MTTEPAGPLTFSTTLSRLRTRFDVGYLAQAGELRAHSGAYPLVSLGELAELVQYGTSALSHVEPVGHPVLRMNNLGTYGLDLSDLKYAELPPRDVARYRLHRGDILIIRTNGSKDLVGKSEVFDEDGEWLFASYLIRVRVQQELADPRYISHFLNTDAGRSQITRASRQILMTNVNSSELRSVQIPLPPLELQRELADQLDHARRSHQRVKADSDEALLGLSERLLDLLRIAVRPVQADLFWSARLGMLRDSGRLDAGAGHPARGAAMQAVYAAQDLDDGVEAVKLGELVEAIRGQSTKVDAGFVGMGDVEPDTGILTSQDRLAGGDGIPFEPDDILYGRLRPYLNKVVKAEHAGVCSPEFVVLRKRPEAAVSSTYIAEILRTSVVVEQARYLVSGNTLPRVSAADVSRFLIPLPPGDRQDALVEEILSARSDALSLRERADLDFELARAAFVGSVMRSAAVS